MRFLLLLLVFLSVSWARAQVQWEVVKSNALGRKVLFANLATDPTADHLVYVTDGRKFIENGLWAEIERLTTAGEVPVARYVFVSSIDANGTDHRNDDFFCNPDHLAFFNKELIPMVEAEHPVAKTYRSLLGISFGGLNAAWFAAMDAPFANYGLLSPITYPRQEELNRRIAFGPSSGQRIFLSTGKQDAERYVDELLALYATKDFTLDTLRTGGAHDFANWRGQLQRILRFLIWEV